MNNDVQETIIEIYPRDLFEMLESIDSSREKVNLATIGGIIAKFKNLHYKDINPNLNLKGYLSYYDEYIQISERHDKGKLPVYYAQIKPKYINKDIHDINFSEMKKIYIQEKEAGEPNSLNPVNGCTQVYTDSINDKPTWTFHKNNAVNETIKTSPNKQPNPWVNIWDWATITNGQYQSLAKLAIPEKWDFGNENNLSILKHYINITYKRLCHEKKILFAYDTLDSDNNNEYATFNTGLFDRKFDSIYALFKKSTYSNDPRYWYLIDFVVDGEDAGKTLHRTFYPLPERAFYFEDLENLIYIPRTDKDYIAVDWSHIILERLYRLPLKYLQSVLEPRFQIVDDYKLEDFYYLTGPDGEEKKLKLFNILSQRIYEDGRQYTRIVDSMANAVSKAQTRAAWNYKTIIPIYYVKKNTVSLLFPLYLTNSSSADLALLVQRSPSLGTYQGETILPLRWAYIDSRIIAKPEVDWLDPKVIDEKPDREEDNTTDDNTNEVVNLRYENKEKTNNYKEVSTCAKRKVIIVKKPVTKVKAYLSKEENIIVRKNQN